VPALDGAITSQERSTFRLGCTEKWFERFPNSNRFWIEMNFGGRISSLLVTLFHASPVAFEPAELRSRVDKVYFSLWARASDRPRNGKTLISGAVISFPKVLVNGLETCIRCTDPASARHRQDALRIPCVVQLRCARCVPKESPTQNPSIALAARVLVAVLDGD